MSAFLARILAASLAVVSLASAALAEDNEGRHGTPPSASALRVEGSRLVGPDGGPVSLRGINLGNWFLIEPWMYGQNLPDEATFLSVLRSRFGEDARDRLLELHRESWITPRDMAIIADAGFNSVRLPFNHTLVEAAPFRIDEAGLDHLRRAIRIAADAGLYVVLDLHAAPGGQSTDGPSGDITQNSLWTDPEAQERTAWLWQRLAREFKNEPNFVAYDLLNEPFGDFSGGDEPVLVDIMGRTIESIRVVDPDRLVLLPATLAGLRFYGDPRARGWVNAGFTEHFYPGLFDGSPPTLGSHARLLAAEVPDRVALGERYGAPFVLGEFNPVFDRAGAPRVVRSVLDAAEALDSHAFVWAYKIVKTAGGVEPDNWYLATNAETIPLGDIRSTPLAALESIFASLGTMPLAVDQAYADTLTAADPPPVLTAVDRPPTAAPAVDPWPLWSVADIGPTDIPGGQALTGAGPLSAERLTLFGAGRDLFGRADSLRLAARAMPPSFAVSAVLHPFEGGRFAQAGVTLRASDAPGAAHLSIVAFPGGNVAIKARDADGETTSQRHIATAGFPVGLGLQRSGSGLAAWITDDRGVWTQVGVFESPALGQAPLGGFFALANRDGPLTVARFDGPRVDVPGSLAPAPDLEPAANLLSNPSFETAGGNSSTAASWSRLGPDMSRQTGWTPTRDGNAVMAYRHWEAGNGPSSIDQVVAGLTPGQTYTWTVHANRDNIPPGRALPESVELRVETLGDPGRWLESVTFPPREIATDADWSRLQVCFVATQTQHRLRLEASPAASGARDGAIKFDSLELTPSP